MVILIRSGLLFTRKGSGRYLLSTERVHVPKPTWSVKLLQLDQIHPPTDDLDLLAKRACLNIRQLPSEDQDRLRQDVGNMLFMMQQTRDRFSDDPAVLYDVPRGVTATPVREDEVADENMSKLSKDTILKKYLKQEGSHMYFECEALRNQR